MVSHYRTDITMEEVQKHNTAKSCWLVMDNKVYDVTTYLQDHPGGTKIMLQNSGKDAKEAFLSIKHSTYAVNTRDELLIGQIQIQDPTIDFKQGIYKLFISLGIVLPLYTLIEFLAH